MPIPAARAYKWATKIVRKEASYGAGYTDLANPASPPTGTPGTGGSLAAGNWLLAYSYTNSFGETMISPTQSFTVASSGTIAVNAVTPLPGNATGVNWYLSISVGSTTLVKQSSNNGAGFTISVAANTGTPPTYNSATDFSDWLVPIAWDAFERTPHFRDDEAEITGAAGATDAQIESWEGAKAAKYYASPEIMTGFYALQLGNVATVGSGDPWTSTIRWPSICTINPPSFAMLEAPDCAGQTADFATFKGICIEQTELDIKGRSNMDFSIATKNDGSETVSASISPPATKFTVNKLLGSYAVLKLGPVGTEDISALLRSMKVTIKSGLVEPPNVAAGLYVTEMQYGDKFPKIEADLVIKGDRQSLQYGYFKNKTVLNLNLNIQVTGASPARGIQYLATQVILESCKIVPSGSETQLQFKLKFLFNAVDGGTSPGPARIIGTTGASAYLQ